MGETCGFDYSIVDRVVDAIVEDVRPEKIIIFGSVANRTARPDSDVDMLIVMDTDKRPVERSFAIERALFSRNLLIDRDIIVVTPAEFEDRVDDEYSFVHHAFKTGVVAYEV